MGQSPAAKNLILSIPYVSDVVRNNYRFTSRLAACRGVYSRYDQAKAAAARFSSSGYDLSSAPFCAPEFVADNANCRRRDYPVLFWLSQCVNDTTQILNLGGNAGSEYFTYRQFVRFPPRLRWTVWELPHVVRFGKGLLEHVNAPGLSFTTRLEDADGADTVITCGAMQYFEQDLSQCLKRLSNPPQRLLINRVPLYDGETFFTVQSVLGAVVPYRIQNRQEFVDSLAGLGFRLVDCWYDFFEISIPFHPEHTVTGFHGFYFERNPWTEPDWRSNAVAAGRQVAGSIRAPSPH